MAYNSRQHIARRVAMVCVALVVSLWLTGCCTQTHVTRQAFQIGDTTIHVRTTQIERARPTFLNLHDDENTSVSAGKRILRQSGGRLIELEHGSKRLISFDLAGQTYRFDPNRIFSASGVTATLTRTKNYSTTAHVAVEEFASRFIEDFHLDHEPVIIALHNTGGGGLSINSYLATGDKPTTASAVHVSTNRFAGDFFYVTDRRFFDYLKARDFNVTLQDDTNVPDDGSASVYFARKVIPYLNIEADHSHLDEQIEMVRIAREMVQHFGLVRSAESSH